MAGLLGGIRTASVPVILLLIVQICPVGRFIRVRQSHCALRFETMADGWGVGGRGGLVRMAQGLFRARRRTVADRWKSCWWWR